MQRPTIKDIATKAGVSIATVSYVINRSRAVSPDIAKRVLKVARDVGYRPDSGARSLRTRKTKMLGLIVPDNSNPFFAEIAKGVEDSGFERGYGVLLCNSNGMPEREKQYVDLLLSKRVDGILLASTTPSMDFVGDILQSGTPLSILFREPKRLPLDSYRIDNQYVGYLATRYLLELGHRTIAHVRARSPLTASGRRERGYVQAMEEFGLEPDERLMPRGNNLIDSGAICATELVDAGYEFTALFAANDAMAIGAMKAFADRGIAVPDDISVIGVDDIILSSYTRPALTTVFQPKYDLGRMAAENLLKRIDEPDTGSFKDYLLDTKLVVRQSTKPPKGT